MSILIFKKCVKIDENGSEWVRHGSPRADIRRGRSYKLSDASGRPPDAPWGRFKAILIDFGVDKGSTEFSGFFSLYIPSLGNSRYTTRGGSYVKTSVGFL